MEQISFHDLSGAAQRRLVHGTLSGVKDFFQTRPSGKRMLRGM